MSKMSEAIGAIARAEIGALSGADGYFGRVTRREPLQVELESGLRLDAPFLGLCQHLTDYEIEFELNENKAGTELTQIAQTDGFFVEHEGRQNLQVQNGLFKSFAGKGTIKLRNHLKVGDKVFMIRFAKGQFFQIVDRVGEGEEASASRNGGEQRKEGAWRND